MIFVFGSNEAGKHGKGAAKEAVDKYQAVYGQAEGLQGQAYAIPTKDKSLKPLPLDKIQAYVCNFCQFALNNPNLTFVLTPVGTGLAGYSKKDIAVLFKKAGLPPNVFLTSTWLT